jgi:hypothetical protein
MQVQEGYVPIREEITLFKMGLMLHSMPKYWRGAIYQICICNRMKTHDDSAAFIKHLTGKDQNMEEYKNTV